jgi:hypothetical protein
MSKAKELAREMLDDAKDRRYKGHATIEFFDKVEELCNAILSEPEPELRGFIEVTYTADSEIVELIPINQYRVVIFNDRCAVIPIINTGNSANVYMVKETYNELRQLIKEAS